LRDDFLREIYDDARAFPLMISAAEREAEQTSAPEAEIAEPERKVRKPQEEPKELSINFNADYYKILGVDPSAHSTTASITKAFRHRVSLVHPNNALSPRTREPLRERDRRRLDLVREAFEVLSNDELRRRYDSGRAVPLKDRVASRDRGRGGGARGGRRKKKAVPGLDMLPVE